MIANAFDTGAGSLPGEIPIFPLAGALLLPHGHLPLNIFEPRYLNMVEDVLGKHRLIGMIQPVTPDTDPIADDAELFTLGCAGRIVSFEEMDSGRFMISLRGICRFNVSQELETIRGYRTVKPDFSPYLDDMAEDNSRVEERSRMLEAVRKFFEFRRIEVDWEAIEEAEDEALVTSLAMICPFEPSEKQALLACKNLNDRGSMLVSLLEMALLGLTMDTEMLRH